MSMKFHLVGRLTKDPVVKETTNGKRYANFALSSRRSYKTKEGKYEYDTYPFTVWDKTVDYVTKNYHQGNLMEVTGTVERAPRGEGDDQIWRTDFRIANIEFVLRDKGPTGGGTNGSQPTGETRAEADEVEANMFDE